MGSVENGCFHFLCEPTISCHDYGRKGSGEHMFFLMVKIITTQVIFYILCAMAVVVPSVAEEKCDHAASDIGFLEVEDRDH